MRQDWDTSAEAASVRVCAKCGKKFVPAPFHQFVSYRKLGKIYYCKWTCYNHRNDTPTKVDGRKAKAKKVLMYDRNGDFVNEFDNAQQAALWLTAQGINANNRHIQAVCRGEQKHHHGYLFKYKE